MEIEVMQNARTLAMPAAFLIELDRNGASPDVYRELVRVERTSLFFSVLIGKCDHGEMCEQRFMGSHSQHCGNRSSSFSVAKSIMTV